MRKVLLSLLFAVAAITGSAQTTYNVRIGLGAVPVAYSSENFEFYETYTGTTLAFQVNIPVNTYKTLTISPAFMYTEAEGEPFGSVPAHLGYKIGLGNKSILFPKIGPVIAFSNDGIMYGLSTEFAWEYKHFVIAANYFHITGDEVGDDSGGFHLTLGYKF